jgi:hypothetical protein
MHPFGAENRWNPYHDSMEMNQVYAGSTTVYEKLRRAVVTSKRQVQKLLEPSIHNYNYS